MGGPAQPSGKVSELAPTAAADGAHLQGARRSITCDNTPTHPLPPEALTWGVCGGLAPERGLLGPLQVRRGPTPRPGGPRRQVGGVGLPPDRHPSEAVVALATHFAAFARGSAPSPALVRPQARARRAPEGRPDPRGRCLHAQARRESTETTSGLLGAGALLLRRLLCKRFLVPSSRDSQGRAVSLAPTPCAAAATPGSLRLALSPDAATAAADLGCHHPLLSGPIASQPPRAPRVRPVVATAAAAAAAAAAS